METKDKEIEIFMTDMVDVEFVGPVFSDSERTLLSGSVWSIRGTEIEMGLSIVDGKLQPISMLLTKLDQNPNIGDINVLMLNKTGSIIGTKTFSGCDVMVSDFLSNLSAIDIPKQSSMVLSIVKYKTRKFDGIEYRN